MVKVKKSRRFSSRFGAGVSLRIIDSYPVDLIALYLQVIDVFLCVQVDAHGFLLDGHDGETHVDAAVQLPFLDLIDKVQSVKSLATQRKCRFLLLQLWAAETPKQTGAGAKTPIACSSVDASGCFIFSDTAVVCAAASQLEGCGFDSRPECVF